mgnify:CR=1 FL=1
MLNSYWEYAGTRYRHKFRAIEASHGDIQNISFKMFENKTFQNFDWSIEPAQSFKSLMKLRALQLRDSYPYLKFCFSGGADSTTVLKVFLENNIFINEIVVWKFGNNLSNYEIDQYTKFLKQPFWTHPNVDENRENDVAKGDDKPENKNDVEDHGDRPAKPTKRRQSEPKPICTINPNVKQGQKVSQKAKKAKSTLAAKETLHLA